MEAAAPANRGMERKGRNTDIQLEPEPIKKESPVTGFIAGGKDTHCQKQTGMEVKTE